MDIVPPTPRPRNPRPASCPICGLTADNGIMRHAEITTMATYICTEGHLFAVTWLEVA